MARQFAALRWILTGMLALVLIITGLGAGQHFAAGPPDNILNVLKQWAIHGYAVLRAVLFNLTANIDCGGGDGGEPVLETGTTAADWTANTSEEPQSTVHYSIDHQPTNGTYVVDSGAEMMLLLLGLLIVVMPVVLPMVVVVPTHEATPPQTGHRAAAAAALACHPKPISTPTTQSPSTPLPATSSISATTPTDAYSRRRRPIHHEKCILFIVMLFICLVWAAVFINYNTTLKHFSALVFLIWSWETADTLSFIGCQLVDWCESLLEDIELPAE